MTKEALRQLVELAWNARLAGHTEALQVSARAADAAQRMALALGALAPRESVRYFDLITNAMRHRDAELKRAELAPRPWAKEGR